MTASQSSLKTVPAEKISGTGNSFLFVQSLFFSESTLSDLRNFAKAQCAAHSVDGLALWDFDVSSRSGKFLIVNSDGSLAGTCGNALRCFAFLLLKRNLSSFQSPIEVTRIFETYWLHELHTDETFASETQISFATLTLGTQTNKHSGLGYVEFPSPKSVQSLHLSEKEFRKFGFLMAPKTRFVTLANPHWFFYSDQFSKFSRQDFIEFGEFAQQHLLNLTDIKIPVSNIGMCFSSNGSTESTYFSLTVYERGAGLTACCGSGAVAASHALKDLGEKISHRKKVSLKMPGGTVSVELQDDGKSILGGEVLWEGELSL